MFFQSLPPTQYDLRFTVAGFNVRVHPLFWLIALLLGSLGDLLSIPIWVFVLFVSILIHELGHALAFRYYGVDSHILLHAMGGLTIPDAAPWGGGWANVSPSPRQQIVISLAGPFTGFLFAMFIILGANLLGGVPREVLLGFIPVPQFLSLPIGGDVVNRFIELMLWVNIFWGLINLLPVYPLDGGQVSRNILIQYDPWDGVRKSLWLSVIAGGVVALISLLTLRIYIAILFGLLAFQSYQSLQGRY